MFNALLYSQELQKAGFSRDQADASLRILIEVMNENFATKSDLKELELAVRADMKDSELRLRSEIHASKEELRSDIHRLETKFQGFESRLDSLNKDLTIRVGGMIIAALGFLTVILKLVKGV